MNRTFGFLLCLSISLGACKTETYQPDDDDDAGGVGEGTGTDDSGSGTDSGGGGVDECAGLAQGACIEAGCELISGRPLVKYGDGFCVDSAAPAQALGCQAVGTGCGDAETVAHESAEAPKCFLFPSTCIPQGWSECSSSAYVECPEGGPDGGGT